MASYDQKVSYLITIHNSQENLYYLWNTYR